MSKKAEDVLKAPAIIWLREPTFDQDGVQVSSGIDQFGREHPDPVPLAPPVSIGPQKDTMIDTIRRLMRDEYFRAAVDNEGFESFEEAEDFDIEDDPLDPLTPYEKVFEPPAPVPPPVAPAGPGAGADAPVPAPGPVQVAKPAATAEPPLAAERASSEKT